MSKIKHVELLWTIFSRDQKGKNTNEGETDHREWCTKIGM